MASPAPTQASTPSETPPSGARARVEPRCPRCGGAVAKRRTAGRANPFLATGGDRGVTCVDCGLDFEVEEPAPRSPW